CVELSQQAAEKSEAVAFLAARNDRRCCARHDTAQVGFSATCYNANVRRRRVNAGNGRSERYTQSSQNQLSDESESAEERAEVACEMGPGRPLRSDSRGSQGSPSLYPA